MRDFSPGVGGESVRWIVGPAPAQAGATWSGPSEVSSKFGRTVVVSDGGPWAAWVRTNKTSSSASGPIRTAWHLKKKKKWTSSAPIPGASESTNVQLSNDGNAALIESGTTGYLMSVRDTKNTWLTAQSIVSGMDLGSGVMSGDAKTLVYVDWGPDDYPTPAGKLYFVTQNADGTWPAPTMLGTANPEGRYGYQSVLAFFEGWLHAGLGGQHIRPGRHDPQPGRHVDGPDDHQAVRQ